MKEIDPKDSWLSFKEYIINTLKVQHGKKVKSKAQTQWEEQETGNWILGIRMKPK